jgi:TolA-binding protein
MKDRAEPASAAADEEVVPPATADSPAVRDAWLQRIRELLRNGQTDAARDSLREFRHRYPQQVLPEDLRALGE